MEYSDEYQSLCHPLCFRGGFNRNVVCNQPYSKNGEYSIYSKHTCDNKHARHAFIDPSRERNNTISCFDDPNNSWRKDDDANWQCNDLENKCGLDRCDRTILSTFSVIFSGAFWRFVRRVNNNAKVSWTSLP